jgi:hypothetical protein
MPLHLDAKSKPGPLAIDWQRVALGYEQRVAVLEAALIRAVPYVVAFAENCPNDDGGTEAKDDLLHVRAALQK